MSDALRLALASYLGLHVLASVLTIGLSASRNESALRALVLAVEAWLLTLVLWGSP